MAIIWETRASNGVRLIFHDDAYAGRSSEELERRRRNISRVWTEAAEREYKRRPPEERQAYLDRLWGRSTTNTKDEG